MRLLVTGAGGMLGQEFVRAARYVNHEVLARTHDELDVTDAVAVRRTIRRLAPDAVVNCAAWTDVDGAEADPEGAALLNSRAAGELAVAADTVGAAIVQPSTDYVFDGEKRSPYVESDRPNPLSVYGATKLAGEHAVAEANQRHYVVRTSWLFGPYGANFVGTMLRLGREVHEVVVVRDQIGCPTYTGHLADALLRLVEDEDFGLHHMAGGGECSWFEFALEIFKQAAIDCHVLSCTTEEFPRPARRPPHSVLGTEREYALYLPDWRLGLRSYLGDRAVAR